LDAWASLENPGWGFHDLEPYYRKVSTIHPPTEETKKTLGLDYFDSRAECETGPLQISFGDSYNSLNTAWLETFGNLGYRKKDDPTGFQETGAFIHPATIDPQTKTRSYAATAYYTSAGVSERTNLTVLTEAHVNKVLVNKTHDGSVVASGVLLVTKDGQTHDVLAKEEVILSAGALHSPKILELSGIGGRDLLESYGIPVVIDNSNVGENLQDHAIVAQSFEVNDGIPTGDLFRSPDILNAVVAQYQTNGAGPLGSSTLCSSYMPLVDDKGRTAPEELRELLDKELTNYSEFPARERQYKILRELLETSDEASAQYLMFPAQLNVHPNGPTTVPEMLNPSSPGNYFTIMTMLNRPFSRGACHIQSADPKQKCLYDPRFCSHPLDLEILARHVQFVEKLTTTEPMASTIIKKDGRRMPDLLASDLEAAREIVRQRQASVFHICGSCAMMPRELGGVVNERLVVHGTKNLRVIDASIFPLEPLGNIQMTVYAVAEKAADIIKEDRRRK
jgi:choline dehydrogenase-like flavoprotein